MIKKFLQNVYGLRKRDEIDAFYDAWSATYDAEIAENGYITPQRCAEALSKYTDDPTLPVLDVGCGTGLSGEALRDAGFTTLHGIDPANEMLQQARDKNVYDEITHFDSDDMPIADESYALVACIGVIGVGAAPVTVLDQVMKILQPGGKLVMSLNDEAIKERVYEGRLNHYLDHAMARLLFREYGDHLPGINLKSYVYIVEKL